MVFYLSLSYNKSLKVSRTLLSILADLNNAKVWRVYTRLLTSKFSSPCTNLLVIVPRAPIIIGIIISFIFQFFQLPSKALVLISTYTFFQSYSVVCQESKANNSTGSPRLLTITRSGLQADIWWSACNSQSQWSLCVSFS